MLKSEKSIECLFDESLKINALLDSASARFANNTAFVCDDDELTYAEVMAKARTIAAALSSDSHHRKGEHVALMAPNIIEFPIITFGVILAGAVQVNINPQYTADELLHQLCDGEVRTIFIHEAAVPPLASIVDKTFVKNIVIIEAKASSAGDLIAQFGDVDVSIEYFGGFLSRAGSGFSSAEDGKSSDLAFVQYTGGTTGFAKGAMLSHGNIVANVHQFVAHTDGIMCPGKEVVLTAIPLYHIFALSVNLISMFHLGATNVLITNPRDMDGLVDQWKTHDITFLTGVNTLFNGMLNSAAFSEIDFTPLKLAIGGGAPVQAAVSARWRDVTGAHLKEGYGLSETSPVLTMTPIDEDDFYSSIGQPVPNTEISIRDEDGVEVLEGESGELCARGPQVMQGYWKKPDATSAVMTDDGFFRTGDIAKIGEDGRLRIVDRMKDMILVSGFNVYPNEIEAVVAQLDGVRECACVGMPDEKTGESPCLFVSKKDVSLQKSSVLDHCRVRLTRYKIPSHVEFIDEIPKSAVGKILRRELVGRVPAVSVSG